MTLRKLRGMARQATERRADRLEIGQFFDSVDKLWRIRGWHCRSQIRWGSICEIGPASPWQSRNKRLDRNASHLARVSLGRLDHRGFLKPGGAAFGRYSRGTELLGSVGSLGSHTVARGSTLGTVALWVAKCYCSPRFSSQKICHVDRHRHLQRIMTFDNTPGSWTAPGATQ